MRSFALCTILTLLAGCADPPVEIIGECTLTTDEVEIPLDPGERVTAIGIIGEHVLLTTVTSIEPADPEGVPLADIRARWLDASLTLVGDPIDLGLWRDVPAAGRTRWQRVGDALFAQVTADPEYSPTQPHDVDLVHVWTMHPPPDASARVRRVHVPALRQFDGTGELWIGGIAQTGLYETLVPSAAIDDHFVSAVIGSPEVCSGDGTDALFLLRQSDSRWDGMPIHWGEMLCGTPGALHNPALPWLVGVPGGGGPAQGWGYYGGGQDTGQHQWRLLSLWRGDTSSGAFPAL